MQFRNPANGHVETRASPGLWAFVFGGFYFLVGGHWTHFIVWLLISGSAWAIHPGVGLIVMLGMAVVYASLAESIVRNSYLRRGWIEVHDAATENHGSPAPVADFRKCPYCAEDIRSEAIKCKHCGSEVVPLPKPVTPGSVYVESERFINLADMHGVTRGGAGYVWNGRSYSTPAAVEEAILEKARSGGH